MKRSRKSTSAFRGARSRATFSRELAILYEDDAIIAVNKPPGLLAVPAPGSDAPSALSILSDGLKTRVHIVHRIDRFASGVLLFAKTSPDRDSLIRQFLAHAPVRHYLAVVRGHLIAKQGTMVHYFRKQGMHQKTSTARDPKAARAELRYSVERPLRGASSLQIELVTGLQNQIRVQLAAAGNPVIGDRKYSPQEASETRIARVALHATYLEFIHPRTGKTIAIESELPPDIRSLINSLSPRAGGRQRS